MTLSDFAKLVYGITYKPNTTFNLVVKTIGLGLEIKMKVVDAKGTSEPMSVHYLTIIPAEKILSWTEKQALEEIRNHIVCMEEHEIDEFFKYNGVNVREPHPEEKHFLRRMMEMIRLPEM